MHLKRLEMSGFKSFANRTELEFVPGITAVVGPNGSGKSNVTDAIRWVLGEQSAKSLRGSKMEDVIFIGSDSRKPVGFCEVSITLDNSKRILPLDYAEVTVTRRVYRSGESEYLLNRQACRLKDIQELFMDTGIGKEAYSMIGQGRIEEMISNKSEDRRAIFEEAAGIVKYKTRKKEAEKKLADAEQNLLRIRDLIHELRQQLEPLQAQAERAEQWKTLRQELTEVEIAVYVHKIETLNEEWEKTTELVKQLRESQVSAAAVQSTQEARLAEVKGQWLELEQQWEQLQADLLQASEQLEKADAERKVWQERSKNRAERQAKVEQQLQLFTTEQQTITLELTTAEDAYNKKQTALITLRQQIEAIKDAAHTQQTAESMSATQTELEKVKTLQLQLESEHKYVLAQQEEMDDSGLDEEIAIRKTEHEQLIAQEAELVAELADHKHVVEQTTARLSALQTEQKQGQIEQQHIHNNVLQLEKQVVRAQSQWESLQAMEQSHAGFFQGVKAVLEQRSLDGIIGAVASLIQVPKEVELAIETALGGALQHVVVRDERAARAAIQFLKEKRLGRATFLPLNVIKGRNIPTYELNSVKQIDGFLGVANELISTEPRFTKIAAQLLGNVLVTETLEVANQVAKELGHRYRVVTVAGDVVNPGGSMTGGSRQSKAPNLLARGRQLEESEQQLKALRQQQISLQAEEQQLSLKLDQLRIQQREVQTELEEQLEAQKATESQLQEFRLQREHIAERLQQLQQQQQTEQSKKQKLVDRLSTMEEKQQAYQTQIARLEEQLQAELVQRQRQEEVVAERNVQLTEFRIEEAKLQQQTSNLQQEVQRLQATAQKVAESLTQAEAEQQQLAEMEELGEEGWQSLLASLHSHQERKENIQQQITSLREQREVCSRENQELEQTVYEQGKQLRAYEEKLHQQEVRANRLDVELNHLLQKLAEEYETSFEGAKAKYGVPENPNKAERKVRTLKQQLEQLGDVNVGAIEEYQRLTERLTFLTTQEDDLLQAKQQLYKMIAQMVAEMGKRFADSFAMIREEFQDVFVKMFGGGRADLQLSDPDNLLDTGIDIVAQPPGKKLQQLSLLSGGERSLAALALLFAVLRIKPVPFCFLDEVDAALDEANLTRFTHYLQKFADQTQFIIITHRKHTMEGADVLYGITMQESGVSTLVSVKLEEYDESREVAASVQS